MPAFIPCKLCCLVSSKNIMESSEYIHASAVCQFNVLRRLSHDLLTQLTCTELYWLWNRRVLGAVVHRISVLVEHFHEHHLAVLIGCLNNHVPLLEFWLAGLLSRPTWGSSHNSKALLGYEWGWSVSIQERKMWLQDKAEFSIRSTSTMWNESLKSKESIWVL